MKNYTFGSWLKEWLKVYKKPYVKPHTFQNLEIIIRLHIPESLKNLKLVNLSVIDLQKSLNKLLGSRTAEELYNVYRGSLSLAYNIDLISKDVSKFLIKPKHVRNVGSALSPEELKKFILDIEKSEARDFYMFLLYSGVRRSEALNLKWQDIDFEKGLIHVNGTKTEKSNRYIPLFPDLENLLLNIKKVDSKVFHHRADFVSKEFKKYSPHHKLHDLRHTFATRCLECAINMKVVQSWLGHSRLETTAGIYSHLQVDFIKNESEKLKILE